MIPLQFLINGQPVMSKWTRSQSLTDVQCLRWDHPISSMAEKYHLMQTRPFMSTFTAKPCFNGGYVKAGCLRPMYANRSTGKLPLRQWKSLRLPGGTGLWNTSLTIAAWTPSSWNGDALKLMNALTAASLKMHNTFGSTRILKPTSRNCRASWRFENMYRMQKPNRYFPCTDVSTHCLGNEHEDVPTTLTFSWHTEGSSWSRWIQVETLLQGLRLKQMDRGPSTILQTIRLSMHRLPMDSGTHSEVLWHGVGSLGTSQWNQASQRQSRGTEQHDRSRLGNPSTLLTRSRFNATEGAIFVCWIS